MSNSNYPERMTYYDGLFLQANDFTREQYYGLQLLSLHNEFVHNSFGIASGLELSVSQNTVTRNGVSTDKWMVTVTSGYAQCAMAGTKYELGTLTDLNLSRGLYLPEKIQCPVPEDSGDSFYVWLTFSETKGVTDQDKGPNPYYTTEEPKLVFTSSSSYSDDESHVCLGQVVNASTGSINSDLRAYIYDINNIFTITYDGSSKYTLDLSDTLNVDSFLNVGFDGKPPTISKALNVTGGINADTIQTSGNIESEKQLTAQSVSIKGSGTTSDSLTIQQGILSAVDVNVSSTLTTANLTINSDFKVGNVFTAEQGIEIPSGNLEVKNGSVNLTNGNISLSAGNVTLNNGNANITGDATISGKLTADSATITGDFSASEANVTFNSLTATTEVKASTLNLTGDAQVGQKLTVEQGIALTGNAQFNNDLNVVNIDVSGYLNVTENLKVSETINAKTVAISQGLTVTENAQVQGSLTAKSLTVDEVTAPQITSSGTIQANDLKITGSLDSDVAVSASEINSQQSISSQSGNVIRDFYRYERWTSTPSVQFDVKPIATALKESSVMYRVVLEGASNFGPIFVQLSGIVMSSDTSKIVSGKALNNGASISVKQQLNGGQLNITVSPPSTQGSFSQLGFTASVWLFTQST